jgi:hypothetical protein
LWLVGWLVGWIWLVGWLVSWLNLVEFEFLVSCEFGWWLNLNLRFVGWVVEFEFGWLVVG